MELEDYSGVKLAPESPQLARNSSISVTIDDLAEGLLVVSFIHSDNLYQGVLFQLNRERGIPSGISFAKEHAQGTVSFEKAENDPLQTQPLHQRHTYSQGNNNGSSASPFTPISQSSLRRIIKPPARFKNARMSLRLRARPVLCAKCRTLCDEKGETNGKDDSVKDDNGLAEKAKKDRLKPIKSDNVTTATASTTTTVLNGKLKGDSQSTANCTAVAPEDLCYVSVGNKRVVENYWKRPLVQPLIPSSEETYAKLRKHKAPSDNRDRKRLKSGNGNSTSNNISTAISSPPLLVTTNHRKSCMKTSSSGTIVDPLESLTSANKNTPFLTASRVCDKNFPVTRSRQALNLKMCITKLTDLRNERKAKSSKGEATACCSTVVDETSNDMAPHSPNPSECSSEPTTESSPNSTTTTVRRTSSESGPKSSKGSAKKSKSWANRIRQKSTVPVRYRDESYLTKNIFNFNKRRPTDGCEIPVLTICRSDAAANTFKVANPPETTDSTVTTTNDDNENQHDNENTPNTAPSSPSLLQEESTSCSYVGSSSPASPSSSSNVNDAPPNFSIKPNISKPLEIIKTPTIKITFGSSGNGMVVQIPPKVTQHLECSSTTEMKAARKAMKKAKKEARRKRSLSTDLSPSGNAVSPDHAARFDRSNPGSPLMPGEDPNSAVALPRENGDSLADPIPNEFIPLARINKKKKKQKKRRRSSKLFKENDGFTSSSSSHDHVSGFNSSSPYSNSSFNQDFVNHGHSSPSGTSVKSCKLDSISNPDAHETFPSFFKDVCPPPRRRSVPASSTTSSLDAPQRVCINLKRIDTNAYVPLPLHSISAISDNEDSSILENNGVDTDDSEPNEFPVNVTSNTNDSDVMASTAESVDFFKDKETECTYRKGDLVWGKLPACPWWPGKITDILTTDTEEARAKISWYKSTTQSCIRFKMVLPFTEYFDSKYVRSRRRGLYQLAVRDALVEAHKLSPEDLTTD